MAVFMTGSYAHLVSLEGKKTLADRELGAYFRLCADCEGQYLKS